VLISTATLLCVTAIVFALLHLAPGEATDAADEGRVPRAQVEALRSQLHLDDPARTRRSFEQISELLDAVPVRRVRYARRLELLPGVRDEVLRDLSATMLRG